MQINDFVEFSALCAYYSHVQKSSGACNLQEVKFTNDAKVREQNSLEIQNYCLIISKSKAHFFIFFLEDLFVMCPLETIVIIIVISQLIS